VASYGGGDLLLLRDRPNKHFQNRLGRKKPARPKWRPSSLTVASRLLHAIDGTPVYLGRISAQLERRRRRAQTNVASLTKGQP
jgi:hypothetical protein